MSHEPQQNERAPIKEAGQLAPPIVRKPVYECAKVVHVASFIPHAVVTVYANGTEVVGTDQPYMGEGDIKLTRALHIGDAITATQMAFGLTSVQSYCPVSVQTQPARLGRPAIGPTIYACGQVVPVSGLIPSTHVEVYSSPTQPVAIAAANLIGTIENTGPSASVVTKALIEGWFVAARQISCRGTDHELTSPPSVARIVHAEPHPVPFPIVHWDKQIPGNDVANLEGLLVGAAVTVRDETAGKDVGGGLATGDSNWVQINPNFLPPTTTTPRKRYVHLASRRPPGSPPAPSRP